MLPDCPDGSLLVTDSTGSPKCGAPPSQNVNVPANCTDTQALNSDGKSFSCVNLAQGGSTNPLNTKITELTTTTEDLTNKVKNIQSKGGGSSVWVGNTTATPNGQISPDGTDNAITGAAKLCAAQYGAGAHVCTVPEIYYSVLAGKISSANNIAKAWIWGAAVKANTAGNAPAERLHGLSDTCGGYTYPTGDKAWFGVAVSSGMVSTGRWAVRFHNSSDAPCSATLPVACCK